MRSGIILAWLIGEGIICWRAVAREKHPPIPGALLGSSALFAVLALLAEYPPAAPVATMMAFGVDLAALMNAPLIGGGSPSGKTAKQQEQASGIAPGAEGRAPA